MTKIVKNVGEKLYAILELLVSALAYIAGAVITVVILVWCKITGDYSKYLKWMDWINEIGED